ncbi:MAG: hypothetical protein ABSD74_10835 [Rhizomicrobium sp.]|jgi:hypothetical protein
MSSADQAIVDISGLGIRQIASALGRSRQAIDRGIRNEGKDYFRPGDVQKIYSSVCVHYPERKDQLAEYIKQKHKEFANFIMVAAGKGDLETTLNSFTEAVVFVHDFEQFRIDLSAPFETITSLISKSGIRLTFVTSSRRSCEEIDKFGERVVGRETWAERRLNQVAIRKYPVTKHMPAMIIFDPNRDPKAFVTTFNDFAPLGAFQARRLATSLEDIGESTAEHILGKADAG